MWCVRCRAQLLVKWAQQTLLEHGRAALATSQRHIFTMPRLQPTSADPPQTPEKAAVAAAAAAAAASSSAAAAAAASLPSPGWVPRSALQERVYRLLQALSDTGELLGAQVCLCRRGRVLVDAAFGRMGPVDPRPVAHDSLFQLFAAGSPLLATIALQQLYRGGGLRLSSPLSAVWPAFAAAGKGSLTLLDLLTHRSGLADAFPHQPTLVALCDADAMSAYVAAAPRKELGAEASNEHEGAPWGWALWGLLHAITGLTLEALLAGRISAPLQIPAEDHNTERALPPAYHAVTVPLGMARASRQPGASPSPLCRAATLPPATPMTSMGLRFSPNHSQCACALRTRPRHASSCTTRPRSFAARDWTWQRCSPGLRSKRTTRRPRQK